MALKPLCPLCQRPGRLFDPGTTTPQAFFSPANTYAIAAAAGSQRLPIYLCTSCGHGFTPLDIDPSILLKWYDSQEPDATFLADEYTRRVTSRKVLQRIEKVVPGHGRLLDIGAGPGIFVSESKKRGWAATGLEPSRWAVAHGRNKYHVHMLQADMSALAKMQPQSYDVITLFDVIEHVVTPTGLLASAVRLLKPGGLIVITTPRFDSAVARLMGKRWHCIFPAHIHYFTQHSLENTLHSAGLRIIRQKSHTRYVSAPYLWQRLIAAAANKALATRVAKPHRTCLPINIGDEFEVYTKRCV